MKIQCIKARRNIASWLDQPAAQQQRLRQHAQTCPDCRAELVGTLAILEQLEAGKAAYSELRYTGPRPNLREQPALTPAEGITSLLGRGFWRPLPVALVGGLAALSLAIYLLSTGQPPPSPTQRVEPEISTSAEPVPKSQAEPPSLRPASAAAALETIRRQASQLQRPSAPKRPSGLTLRLPSRPKPPKPDADRG